MYNVDDGAPRARRTKVAAGTHKPRWTQHQEVHKSPTVQPRLTIETQVYRVTEVSRCTQQVEIPRTDAFGKLSVTFKHTSLTPSHTWQWTTWDWSQSW